MFKMVLHIILIMTCLVSFAVAQEASVTIPPQSVNISLNGVAQFTCTGVASAFVWKENGIQTNSTNITQHNINVDTVSTIEVQGSSFENGTNITCTAVSLVPLSVDESEPATLLVQGFLESVEDLTMTPINSTTVLISWSPPFTLDGVPILGYNVTITNRENESMWKWVDTGQLLYTPSHLEDISTVTVVPINEVGAGEPMNLIHISQYAPLATTQAELYLTQVPLTTTQTELYATVLAHQFTITTTQATNTSVSATIVPSPSESITMIATGILMVLPWVVTIVFLFFAFIGASFCIVIYGLIRNRHKLILHVSSVPPNWQY